MTVAFRPMAKADRKFVIDAWVSSYRTSYTAGLIAMEDWHSIMWGQIEKVIDRPEATTIVAYESKDPDFIYGFISGDISSDPATLYYVFVKEAFRKKGRARDLFRHIGIDPMRPFVYTCKTPLVSKVNHLIVGGRFNPLVARYRKDHPWKSK